MARDEDDSSNDVREVARTLAVHSFWMGLAFCAIMLVAVFIEKVFLHGLLWLGWIEPDGFLAVLGDYAAKALAVIDCLGLIAIVVKLFENAYKAV